MAKELDSDRCLGYKPVCTHFVEDGYNGGHPYYNFYLFIYFVVLQIKQLALYHQVTSPAHFLFLK